MKFRSSNVVTENRPVSVGIARHQLNSTGTATSHPVGYQNADKPLVEVSADILTLVYLTRCHVAELRLHVLDQFVHVERRTTISVIIRDIIVTMVRYIIMICSKLPGSRFWPGIGGGQGRNHG